MPTPVASPVDAAIQAMVSSSAPIMHALLTINSPATMTKVKARGIW
jgi:hypothetical protein